VIVLCVALPVQVSDAMGIRLACLTNIVWLLLEWRSKDLPNGFALVVSLCWIKLLLMISCGRDGK